MAFPKTVPVEVEERFRKQTSKPHCRASNVQPSQAIIVAGVKHAGLVTHVCIRDEHDFDSKCQCECGHQFMKNYK